MTFLVDALESIARQLADVRASSSEGIAGGGGEQIDVLRGIGEIQRMLDAMVIDVVDEIETADALRERSERVTARAGCRTMVELLQRCMLIDRTTARHYVSAAEAAHEETGLASGEPLPGRFPELTAALRAGEISVAGYLACVGPLLKSRARIGADDMAVADAVLARAATGRDLDDRDDIDDTAADPQERAPRPTVEELAGLVAHLLLRIDPDGAEPDDRAGERNRCFSIGSLRGGTVSVRGQVLPEVAGALQRLIDAYSNPRVQFTPDGEDPTVSDADADADAVEDADAEVPPMSASDLRTPPQKRHDAFAAIVASVAAAEAAPQLGGAAPTLIVSVDAEDFAAGTGRAFIANTDWDVPIDVARHTACAGGVRRVLFDESGAIVGLGTSGRIFTAHQRKSIALRDRTCVIPGCDVRADWCEIHHVQEWAAGGATHTDNGVALCWHHHRTLEVSGWQIRMRDGLPQIRGPAWWDPHCRWRAPGDGYRAVDRALAWARGTSTSSGTQR